MFKITTANLKHYGLSCNILQQLPKYQHKKVTRSLRKYARITIARMTQGCDIIFPHVFETFNKYYASPLTPPPPHHPNTHLQIVSDNQETRKWIAWHMVLTGLLITTNWSESSWLIAHKTLIFYFINWRHKLNISCFACFSWNTDWLCIMVENFHVLVKEFVIFALIQS